MTGCTDEQLRCIGAFWVGLVFALVTMSATRGHKRWWKYRDGWVIDRGNRRGTGKKSTNTVFNSVNRCDSGTFPSHFDRLEKSIPCRRFPLWIVLVSNNDIRDEDTTWPMCGDGWVICGQNRPRTGEEGKYNKLVYVGRTTVTEMGAIEGTFLAISDGSEMSEFPPWILKWEIPFCVCWQMMATNLDGCIVCRNQEK